MADSRAELREAAEKATPGPWQAYDSNEGTWPPRPGWSVANDAFFNPPADDDAPWLAVDLHVGTEHDAAFIALSSPDVVLELLDAEAERDRLAGENEHLRSCISSMDDDADRALEDTAESIEAESQAADRVIARLRGELQTARDDTERAWANVAAAHEVRENFRARNDALTAQLADARRTLADEIEEKLTVQGLLDDRERTLAAVRDVADRHFNNRQQQVQHRGLDPMAVIRELLTETRPSRSASPDTENNGERCPICQGVNGKHDGAIHDAYVADRPAESWPHALSEGSGEVQHG